jgi:antirestriction protein ArdC
MKIASLYESVTNAIVRELENGTVPWVKVWDSPAGGMLPQNAITRRFYSGINVPILWATASHRGYPTHGWATFKQALEAGACVRKGEKATQVVFVKKLIREQENEEEPKSLTVLKSFSVFNVAQIDGLPEPEKPPERPPDERYAGVDAFLAATKAEVRHGPYEPCYIPSQDAVCLPTREHFHGDEHYYATLLHEHVHWTGAEHRLNRQLRNRFGTAEYAAEELVAELGAAFLCAHLGIQGALRHAAYLQSWLKLLKDDARAIFTASAKASEAANYLRAFSEKVPDE